MRNLLTFAFLFIVGTSYAQIQTPAASPSATVEQTVGLTDITVEYSRPGVKDRVIFADDGLVPFGKIWRTGANAATKITFSTDVKVNGAALKAGSYAILTIPTAESWTVNFYAFDAPGFGGYVEKEPTASVSAETMELSWKLENFTISIHNLKSDGADLMIAWDTTGVGLEISIDTDSAVMASIESAMAGPSNNDYYRAASYYYEADKDLDKALNWINKATNVDQPRYWQVRTKALILAKMGKKQEAIDAATQSMDLAMAAGNDDYVRMNKKSIEEWQNM